MYIRRKVFSVLVDEAGEERLYSVNETLLEGYEEREFAEKEEKEEEPKKSHKAAKVAAGVGGAVATTAAGVYAAKKGLLGKKAGEAVNKVIMKNTKAGSKLYEQAVKDTVNIHSKELEKEISKDLKKYFPNISRKELKSATKTGIRKKQHILDKVADEVRTKTPGRK